MYYLLSLPKLCFVDFPTRGSVIGPTFHFNIPKLKFGVVSYGESWSLNGIMDFDFLYLHK